MCDTKSVLIQVHLVEEFLHVHGNFFWCTCPHRLDEFFPEFGVGPEFYVLEVIWVGFDNIVQIRCYLISTFKSKSCLNSNLIHNFADTCTTSRCGKFDVGWLCYVEGTWCW